jgi:hypothetical protein
MTRHERERMEYDDKRNIFVDICDTDIFHSRYDNVTLIPLLLQRGLRFGPIQRNGAN